MKFKITHELADGAPDWLDEFVISKNNDVISFVFLRKSGVDDIKCEINYKEFLDALNLI